MQRQVVEVFPPAPSCLRLLSGTACFKQVLHLVVKSRCLVLLAGHSALGNYSSNNLHELSFFYCSFINDLLGQPCLECLGSARRAQQKVSPLKVG